MGENLKPTLAQALRALADREIELGIVDGALAVSGNTSAINPKLRAAIDDHRAEITRIARCRTALAAAYAACDQTRDAKIAKFRALCDLPEGYSDPSDPFAAGALLGLGCEAAHRR
ncbi:MAG: hypothetical protein ABIY70_14155 [Capsulimonas sp.]|uniref:hypothetical protein n=1 Tax=Capsulimonas sp. TaxID=2494211 RepID=UPI0032634831